MNKLSSVNAAVRGFADSPAPESRGSGGLERAAQFLPSVLTSTEFAYLVRYDAETVRCKIRSRQIKAFGRPARIPCRELEKFGVNLADAAILLSRRSRDANAQRH